MFPKATPEELQLSLNSRGAAAIIALLYVKSYDQVCLYGIEIDKTTSISRVIFELKRFYFKENQSLWFLRLSDKINTYYGVKY